MRLLVLLAAMGFAAPRQTRPAVNAEQSRLLEETRQVSLNYSAWLPNLICTQTIHRDVDLTGSGMWHAADTLTAQVTYFDRKESYRLIARNGRPANQRLENLAGAVSKGEFGSMLRWIFEPEARASFAWNGQESIEHTRVAVFAYSVPEDSSRLELEALSQTVFAGFHGLLWIDQARGLVLRLTAEAEGPEHFPIGKSAVRVEYGWEEIAGHQYLVPVRAEALLTERPPAVPPSPSARPQGSLTPPASCGGCDPRPDFPHAQPKTVEARYRNRIQFRGYRKFVTDSKLKFE